MNSGLDVADRRFGQLPSMRRIMKKPHTLLIVSLSLAFIVLCLAAASNDAVAQSQPTVHQTALGEAGQKTPEVTTEEVQRILVSKSEPLLDVRSAQEYASRTYPEALTCTRKRLSASRKLTRTKRPAWCFIATARFAARASDSPSSLSI